MQTNLLEENINELLENNIQNNLQSLEFNNDVTVEKQNSFLESTLGKAINTGINLALRAVLPDLIESQVIEVKDVLLSQGLQEGIKTIVNSAVDLGKSAIGIFTGKFENISQVQAAVKNGGILDSTSQLLNKVIDEARKNKLINSNVATMLKRGKTMILEGVNNNIEDLVTSQIKSVEKIGKYSENWNKFYQNKDFDGMQREYKKLETELKNVIPLEQTLKNARQIENIHNLIKNNGKDFNISEEELELAKKLV